MTRRRQTGTAVSLLVLLLPSLAPAEDRGSESLTLNQCLALALAHNPSLALERERLHETEADYVVARSGLLPKISASVYYNRLDPNRLNPAGVSGATLFAGETFADLRVEILSKVVFREAVLRGSSSV